MLSTGALLLNRYLLETLLGQGGMGAVYRAQDMLLNRLVAVKLLAGPGAALGSSGRERLLAEAQAVARLNHPNIVAVYDAGEHNKAPFIVMELVEGQSLRAWQPAGLDEILNVAGQVCLALEQAHAAGIIHRDLKPENILLTPAGVVKLMDFGLARSADAPHITEDGALVGTFAYLAPELIQGEPASLRSDLYALGVMLYEFTTRQLPFQGTSLIEVITRHLTVTPSRPARTTRICPRRWKS
jgi:serine/threonine-protein kinase